MRVEQQVIRLEANQQLACLSEMRGKLKEYYAMIQKLRERYNEANWAVPLSSYINFRDALCHYAAACHCEELIELRQEGNAMEEHLHRAVKDMAVNYLQVLGGRIAEVCSYVPTTEDEEPIEWEEDASFYDYVEGLAEREDYKTFIQALHWYYAKNYPENYKILQEWLHKVREFDLVRRDASLRIEKPFSAQGLEQFYHLIDDCQSELEGTGLCRLVFRFGDFFDSEGTEFLLQE